MPSHPLKIWGSGSKWKGLYEISGPLHWLSSWRWWPPKRVVNCIGHCGGEEWAIWVKFVLQISQIAPCHVFTYNRANTRTSMLKNLTFPNYEFGKGQCAFYPLKLSRFGEKKNKVRQKYQNFMRRDPYKLGQTLFWSVLGIQSSWILLNMVNHSLVSHFQKDLVP